MAERCNAKLFQVVRVQGAQDGSVDVVGLERLDVAFQPEPAQPSRDIHGVLVTQ
jgi:hypothetical protein